MTWIKLEDNAVNHPKIAGLSDCAFRLWIASLCYASEFLTDGALPVHFLEKTARKKHRDELLKCGLWEQDAAGNVTIHDYLIHQSSREYVLGERDMKRRRSAFHRDDQLKNQIRSRDGDLCRYCGKEVSWTDRRGNSGGTYDHVIPRGPETLENMVVACRFCNNSKGQRTPEEAGMKLLPIRTRLNTDSIQTQNELRPDSREQIQSTDTENREQQQQRPPTLIQSHKDRERRLQFCAFVGSKIEVPNGLHAELRDSHGGDDPERELQRWYLELNEQAETERWRIPRDKEFYPWFKALYGQKFPAPVITPKRDTSSLMARLEAVARGEAKR